MGTVYLIHFDQPLHHARHYVGYTKDVAARMECHKNNHGARLLQVIAQNGIGYQIVRTWEHVDRKFERWIKNQKNTKDFCPICSPHPRKERRCHRGL